MLSQLDTLIGFCVVMAVVSLLITIVTQIISTFLGLRGKNLADAIEVMILKIDPTIGTDLQGAAHHLADEVLTNPAISDSILSMTKEGASLFDAITMAWRRASAIRPDELLDILQDIAGMSSQTADSRIDLVEEQVKKAVTTRDRQAFAAEVRTIADDAKATLANAKAVARARREAAENATEADKRTWLQEASEAYAAVEQQASWTMAADRVARKADAAVSNERAWKNFCNYLAAKAAATRILQALYDPLNSLPHGISATQTAQEA